MLDMGIVVLFSILSHMVKRGRYKLDLKYLTAEAKQGVPCCPYLDDLYSFEISSFHTPL